MFEYFGWFSSSYQSMMLKISFSVIRRIIIIFKILQSSSSSSLLILMKFHFKTLDLSIIQYNFIKLHRTKLVKTEYLVILSKNLKLGVRICDKKN